MAERERRYQYQPLRGHRDIRLQSFAEGFSMICPRLNCCNVHNWKFIHASLDDPPPYLAISYVWGDPSRRRKFRGLKGCLDVTESVARVLNYLTTQYRTPFNVWIDALCIDQANIDERRTQLRLMRDVYRNSMQVIAWLGEYDLLSMISVRSNNGGWSLESVFEEVNRSARNQRSLDFDPDEQIDPGCQHRLDEGDLVLNTISRVIDSPWFQRIWVFQEVVCGSCVLLVATSGDRSLELLWDELAFYLRNNNLIHIGDKYGSDRRTYGYANACIMAGRRAVMKASLQSSCSQASLSTLLTEVSSYSAATDPRDLVYALIALSEDFDFDDLQPAYQVDTEAVFIEATSLVLQIQRLQTTQPLALLSLAGIGSFRKLSSLPTWVPDWTSSSQYLGFIGGTGKRVPMSRLEVISKRAGFDATRGRPWQPPTVTTADDQTPTLTLQGAVIDRIEVVGRKYPRALIAPETASTRTELGLEQACSIWIQEIRELARSVSPYPTGEPSEEVLWRTLIADSRQDSRPWDVVIGTTCLPIKDQHSHFFNAISGSANIEDELDFMYRREGISEQAKNVMIDQAMRRMKKRYANFLSAFERHGAGRAVFTTTEGYLGLGPPGIEVGDEVCLIFGTHVPFLLRDSQRPNQSPRHSLLVGECYIRGLMHGFGLELGYPQSIRLV